MARLPCGPVAQLPPRRTICRVEPHSGTNRPSPNAPSASEAVPHDTSPPRRDPRRAWEVAGFRRVWAATVLLSLGNWTERIVVGFFVFNQSGSVFLTAASFAARQAPGVIFAPIAGSIADRWPRSRVLGITAIYKTAILGGLAAVAAYGPSAIWLVFILTALGGIGQSFEVPATQGLVTDSVPKRLRMNAVAVQSVGARGIGAFGGLLSGFVIDGIGAPSALGVGAGAFVAAALATLLIKVQRTAPAASVGPGPENIVAFWRQLFRQSYLDLRLLFGIPAVRTLLIVAVLVEMFGFAFGALLPSIAVEVLGTAGTGLGALNMMAALGSLAGVIGLSVLGDYEHKERLLVLITLMYGSFLVLFASSGLLPLSMVLIAGVGMSAGAFDAMQWTLLQRNAPEHMRGRVIGGWVFAIGFGWLGHLGLGALGGWIGVQWALGGAGVLVITTGIVLWRISHRLRPRGEPGLTAQG